MNRTAAPRWPELWAELPEPFRSALDPARPWDLLDGALDEALAEIGDGAIEIALDPRAHLSGAGIAIGRGTRVGPGAVIEGPIRIGRDCEIRAGSYLRGGCWLGDGCVVGANVEVKRGVFLDGARAPHLNYVGDSILGRGVNLGAGTVLSNFRHDGGEITIPTGEGAAATKITTGRTKLGAMLGDGVATGCNSVLNPGTIVGARTQIYTGAQLRAGAWPADSIVKLRQQLEIAPAVPPPGRG